MTPAMESIAITAMATPYSDEKPNDTKIPMTITITGKNVDFIDTAKPVMMLVACPVVDARAMVCTGLNWVPV